MDAFCKSAILKEKEYVEWMRSMNNLVIYMNGRWLKGKSIQRRRLSVKCIEGMKQSDCSRLEG